LKVSSGEPMAESRVSYDRGVWLVLRMLVLAQTHLDRISGAVSVCDGHSTPRYGSPTMSRRPSVLDAQRGGNEYLAANLFALRSHRPAAHAATRSLRHFPESVRPSDGWLASPASRWTLECTASGISANPIIARHPPRHALLGPRTRLGVGRPFGGGQEVA